MFFVGWQKFSLKKKSYTNTEPVGQIQSKFQMMHNMGKEPLCHMPTAKVQISVCIRAVWSEHSLFINIHCSINWFCKRTTKADSKCAGWSGPNIVRKLHKGPFFAVSIKWDFSNNINSFPLLMAHFCHLLISFANSLDPDLRPDKTSGLI